MRGLQTRIGSWVARVFGRHILDNRGERVLRFVEEALELAQTEGIDVETLDRLRDRVYSRPPGTPAKESAQCLLTLLAYGESVRVDVEAVAWLEMHRIEQPEIVAKMHERQAAKVAAGIGRE